MSIIQEALRKAQKTKSGDTRHITSSSILLQTNEIIKSAPRRRKQSSGIIYFFYAAILLIALSPLMLMLPHRFFIFPVKASAKHEPKPKLQDKAAESVIKKTTAIKPASVVADTAATAIVAEPAPVAETYIPPSAAVMLIPVQPEVLKDRDFILSGIMHLEGGPKAIINNSTVVEGDDVDGAVVTKITNNSVTLKRKNSELTVYLK